MENLFATTNKIPVRQGRRSTAGSGVEPRDQGCPVTSGTFDDRARETDLPTCASRAGAGDQVAVDVGDQVVVERGDLGVVQEVDQGVVEGVDQGVVEGMAVRGTVGMAPLILCDAMSWPTGGVGD